MTKHVHAAMIKEWAEDTSLIVEKYNLFCEKWIKDTSGTWCPKHKYRFRQKHQDLIDQKAARPELIIEWRSDPRAIWYNLNTIEEHKQYPNEEYRLVEPPKKKKTVKMWQWVVQVQESFWVSEFFHKSLEEAQSVNGGKVIQRADWTEIEVEV